MVHGLDVFRTHFADFDDKFVVIGGTACNLIYARYGISERVTKDIDVVIIAETFDQAFYRQFIDFIQTGDYKHRSKDGRYELYRFERPSKHSFPAQVELLSRRPEYVSDLEQHLGPLATIDSSGSLSAIMLEDAYYDLLKDGIDRKDGLPILCHEYLPLFKMKAWLNLTDERNAGVEIHSEEINKHRRDVLRLCSLFEASKRIVIGGEVKTDVRRFLVARPWDDVLLRNLGLSLSTDEMVQHIAGIYLGE